VVNRVHRINKAPQPTLTDPLIQIKWVFFQLESEYHNKSTAEGVRNASNTYLRFIVETNAYYDELINNPRFYLDKYWETDALIRFNKWIDTQTLASKSKYSTYKRVRQVMDMAYSLRIIDTIVYHAPRFKGVSETKQRSAYTYREQEIINASLAKWISLGISVLNGYTHTGLGIPYRTRRSADNLKIKDSSISSKEASDIYGANELTIRNHINGVQTPELAVELEPRPKKNSIGFSITVEGVTYPSHEKAALAYGVCRSAISSRIRKGYSPEQAVGIEPIHVKAYDERALIWMFENVFNSNPLEMLDEYRSLSRRTVVPEKMLRKLFAKWGVWPYVDDNLIMPLAMELAMLTGLNVESLKLLKIDSYTQEHPLTGQPAIRYHKLRSSSRANSSDKELHIPILDLEDLYVDNSVNERIHNVIQIVKELTGKIRAYTPISIADRLFIFEDVEQSRINHERIVVAIDPSGKSSSWRRKFAREEGLTKIFGDSFRFNIARCRPTLATNMVLNGADIFQVQTALGHQSVQITASYLDQMQLNPLFNKTISDALKQVSRRSKESIVIPIINELTIRYPSSNFQETLSGCGCHNPYNPSENVRKVTNFKDDSVCKYWNMCLFCNNSVVTQDTLPKLINYQSKLKEALNSQSQTMQGRTKLFTDTIAIIDGILESGNIFPDEVIDKAYATALSLDDVLIDQLVYQGF
jgi:integrase